jgi:hypothetical protein
MCCPGLFTAAMMTHKTMTRASCPGRGLHDEHTHRKTAACHSRADKMQKQRGPEGALMRATKVNKGCPVHYGPFLTMCKKLQQAVRPAIHPDDGSKRKEIDPNVLSF